MIAFEEAQGLIAEHQLFLKPMVSPVASAQGFRLFNDLFSPLDLPPFDNAAVDGFAINKKSLHERLILPVIASVRAEKQSIMELPPGMAAKIMTGAPMPQGADTVAMKEDVEIRASMAHFRKLPQMHENVRFRGEDIAQGDLLASRGTLVTPAMLALLYSLGIEQVTVFRPPSIKIISTGDELIPVGRPLNYGQVYYLMGPMLKAQCHALGIDEVSWQIVGDNQTLIEEALHASLNADIVLLTGGMSQGDYDLVRKALQQCLVQEIFYQGAWRPGKPLYFGKKDNSLVFGLPGNPVAAYVCFHVFVRKAILTAMKSCERELCSGVLLHDFSKKSGFTFFARAQVNEHNQITIMPGQGSHQIFSLSKANGLCVLPSEQAIVKAFQVVQYYRI